MNPPSSHPTTATAVPTGGSDPVATASSHSSRPHAPHLLNRSQSEDSGHLSLSTEHARFTQHQVIVNRLNQEIRDGANHDTSRQHGPATDDTRHSVSAADALALIQFSRSERHATYSPVNRQQQHEASSFADAEVVAANQRAHVTTIDQDGQLDASPMLSAATNIADNGTSQQQSLPHRIPPGPHVFSSTRSDTITELFGPPVPQSAQQNDPGQQQNASAIHTGSLRSSLSMSVFDIRQSALANDEQSVAPRSPVPPPLMNDSESTGDNTTDFPASSLRPSGMSQYIDLTGMQSHQIPPPTTAAAEFAAGTVTRAATLAASAPMTPAVSATAPSFSQVVSGPGSPTSPPAPGHPDALAKNQVQDCPSQAAMWTPRLGHRIPDPNAFGQPRPQVAPTPQISDCVTTRITTDCSKEKPKKLVAPPLRKRTVTNPTGYPREILDVLEAHFEKCSHLCKERAEMIGQEAGGLEKFRVDNWFHNRRKNYKKRGYELKCDPNECVDAKLKPAKPPAKRKKSAPSTRQSSMANMDTGLPMGTPTAGSAHNGVGANASNPTMAPSLSAFFQSMMASSAPLSRFHLASVGGASAGSMSAGQSAFGNTGGPVSQVSASSLPQRMQTQTTAAHPTSSAQASQQPLQHPIPGLNTPASAQTHGQPHFTHSQTPAGLQHHPMAGFPLAPSAFPLYPTNGQVGSFSTFPAWPMPSMGTPPMLRPPTNAGLSSAQQPSPQAPPTPFMSPASYYSMLNMAHLMHHHQPPPASGPAATVPMQFPMTHSPFILVQPRPPVTPAGAAGGAAATAGTTTAAPSSSVPVSSLLSNASASTAGRSLSTQSTSTDGEASEGANDMDQKQEGSTVSTASSMAAYMARSIEGPSGEHSGAESESSVFVLASQATKRKAEEEASDETPNQAKRPRQLPVKKEG